MKTKLAKRRYPRRKFYHPIGILLKGEYFIAAGKELGEGGMLIAAETVMEVGFHCLVNFKVPGDGFCVVRCEVRSEVEKDGEFLFGLRFLNLDYKARTGIRGHIAAKTMAEAEEELKMLV